MGLNRFLRFSAGGDDGPFGDNGGSAVLDGLGPLGQSGLDEWIDMMAATPQDTADADGGHAGRVR
jgi:hypothetical protein